MEFVQEEDEDVWWEGEEGVGKMRKYDDVYKLLSKMELEKEIDCINRQYHLPNTIRKVVVFVAVVVVIVIVVVV